MIPLRDVIPSRTTPVVTIALILLNGAVFFHEMTLPDTRAFERFMFTYGLVPAQFSMTTVFTSMFLHGDLMHFLGNMLYLWIFGDNVEDRVGHGRFVAFYLLCGGTAAAVQMAFNPDSAVPMIGASGAIAGVLGAYLVMFPHSRVLTLLPFIIFWDIVEIPAIILLGLWFVLQVVSGVGTLGQRGDMGGVAFWAHAAGFVTGVATIALFRRPERQRVEWWDRA